MWARLSLFWGNVFIKIGYTSSSPRTLRIFLSSARVMISLVCPTLKPILDQVKSARGNYYFAIITHVCR